jgi:hypothetical protein
MCRTRAAEVRASLISSKKNLVHNVVPINALFLSCSRIVGKNEAAGAADAARAMLFTSCPKIALLAAIFAFLCFL